MTFEEVARLLNPDIYEQFKKSLALGKWPDGREMTKEQKEICIQAIIYYEEQQNIEETERLGYIDNSKKKPKSDDDVDEIRILH